MKNDCNIILDILPLYIEGMVSDDTVSFVEEHLTHCPMCQEELAKLKSPTKADNMQSCSVTCEKDALPLKILKKKLRRKRIITAVVSAVLAIAFLIGGFTLLTQPHLIKISDSDLTAEQVFRFETEDGPMFFVFYSFRYSGYLSGEHETLWDENGESPTLVINKKRPLLNLTPSAPACQEFFFTGAWAYDTETWDEETQDFKIVEYTSVKFGDTVIWSEEANSAQEVPEYVYVLYDRSRHPGNYDGVSYDDEWIQVQYADGHTVRWDYEGNVLMDTSVNSDHHMD